MYSVQIATSNGTLTRIELSIDYFDKDDISLYRDTDTAPMLLGVDWQWDGATSINLLNGPEPAGTVITIRRSTDRDRAYNIYDGGAAFSRASLDENFLQMIYLAQEFTEGSGLSGLYRPFNMNGYRITALGYPIEDTDAASKLYVDDAVEAEAAARAAADAYLQSQLSGDVPLQASAFSEISWHGQSIQSSVTIPAGKNAWSFGPLMTIEPGQTVTVGTGSFWTIADGHLFNASPDSVDYGTL